MTANQILTARLFLPVAAAKTTDEYLAENDNDATAALKAARADVAAREKQNTAARRFKSAFEGVLKGLGIDTENLEDTDAAAEAAQSAVRKIQTAAGSSGEQAKTLEAMTTALKELGIDPGKIKEGVEAVKAQVALAGEAATLKRDAAFGKAAEALGFDAAKLARVLRDETATPELRKIKVAVKNDKGEDVQVEQDTWVLPGEGDAFTVLSEHGDVKGFEAALKKSAEAAAQTVTTPTTPVLVEQRASVAAGPASLTVNGGLPMGAGSI